MLTLPEEQLEDILRDLPEMKLSKKRDFALRLRFWWLDMKRAPRSLFAAASDYFNVRRVLAGAGALVMILAGITSYSYFSPQVAYGDALYSLKRQVESVEVAFAKSPLAKVSLHTKFAARRLAELKVLLRREGIEEEELLSFVKSASAQEETFDPILYTLGEIRKNTQEALHSVEEVTLPSEVRIAINKIEELQEEETKVFSNLERVFEEEDVQEGLEEEDGEEELARREVQRRKRVLEFNRSLREAEKGRIKVEVAREVVEKAIEQGEAEVKVEVKIIAEEIEVEEDPILFLRELEKVAEKLIIDDSRRERKGSEVALLPSVSEGGFQPVVSGNQAGEIGSEEGDISSEVIKEGDLDT
ncbi:MAG TPA: hypothetical protein ENI70_02010, partial [Candidatus Peregrinibacteria bacterium]|nr:hypothetical protein [Candidatus Peregrinibacteria bacterium]